MKERPILFNAPMVRALLDGSKTQTRRIVKWQGPKGFPHFFGRAFVDNPAGVKRLCVPYHHPNDQDEGSGNVAHRHYCPHGDPGDRLWVRETCRAHELTDEEAENDTFGVIARLSLEYPVHGLDGVFYPADGAFREIENSPEAADAWGALNAYRGLRGAMVPSIHMPRWASRITLEVTGVRIERLQDISEEDAMAEGARGYEEGVDAPPPDGDHEWSYRASFQRLWESLNGHGSWDANPWVWVVEFRRVEQARQAA